MKINPEVYKDLIGKRFIFASLSLDNDKGGLVENIKESTFKIVRSTITKIKVIEQKNNWQEIAYLDKEDRFFRDTIFTYKEGGLRQEIEQFKTAAPKYIYCESLDEHFANVADYKVLDEGQTDEEIRTILEEKVKAQLEKAIRSLGERIARLKEKEEDLKRFMN